MWLSSVPQAHILLVSNRAFCGFPQFLKIIFYRYTIEPFVAVLSSSGSYSAGVQSSLLWLSSVLQDHILQVYNWAFCGSPQFLRLIFCWCPIEPSVAFLRSSRSYSTGIQLSLLWLSSVPQTHILQVSNSAFYGCPNVLKVIFYRCPIGPFVAVISSSDSRSTGVRLYCGWTQFLRFIFYRYPTELFVVSLSSSGSYSAWFWLSFLWLTSVPSC